MIIGLRRANIFDAPLHNIVFAVNSEGINDAGFAGQVSRQFWPELAHIGPQPLGTVLTHTSGANEHITSRTFHALVCHSLARGGWANASRYVDLCLKQLPLPPDTYLAAVAIGSGPVGQMGGADTYGILDQFAESEYKFVIFTRG